ncbi:sugar/nucleoside kinase (ribokinase family) [Clostridiales Family XIII bacterium PM5-7]
MKKVLVIGSTVADIVINLDRLPTTAEDINIVSQEMALGGCAYNVSSTIRHFGVPYILFSPIGTGIYGDFIRNQLAAKGLASKMPTPNQANGCCYCFVEASGERTFVCDHGAEYLFQKEWFEALNMDKISRAYICGLEIEDKTGDVIVSFLEENPGLPIIFAPGPRICHIDTQLMERIFAMHPMIHLNREEVCGFTGIDHLEEATKALFAQTGNTVVVTNGADGAYYYDGIEMIRVAPAKVGKVVDTIGAGDSHVGTIISCLENGMSMYDAIKQANAVSALVVERKGATLTDEEFNQIR